MQQRTVHVKLVSCAFSMSSAITSTGNNNPDDMGHSKDGMTNQRGHMECLRCHSYHTKGQALISIAHPDFRVELAGTLRSIHHFTLTGPR